MPTSPETLQRLHQKNSLVAGLCQVPHPDPKHQELITVTVVVDGERVEEERIRYNVKCMRFDDHEGDHAAFVFAISAPETWSR